MKSKGNWLGYLALVMLFALALLGVPSMPRGLAPSVQYGSSASEYPRVVVLGIDGMDPDLLAETIQKFPDRMRNFAQLAREQGIHALDTSIPPQSPVAWSNFITGLDPGGHGIFEFFHRDPTTRGAIPATTVTEAAGHIDLWADWKLPTGGASEPNRTGKAFWTILAEHGVPADIWRMPANFPVEKAKGWSFSGMMTPAIDSAYGECTVYSTNPPLERTGDPRVIQLTESDGVIYTRLTGPANAYKQHDPAVSVPLRLALDRESMAALLDVDGAKLVLEPGEWSDFVSVTFPMVPGWLPLPGGSVNGSVRFYLRSLEPEVELYASPVNIDPSAPALPVSEPAEASAQVADRIKGIGAYYTQGMPEDVNALKREVISVPEFMQQAHLVQDEAERMLDFALERYLAKPEGGFLFFYFSGVDLCSHMLWRHFDDEHPHHDAAFAAQDSSAWSRRPGSTWKDVIYDLYMEMDPVVGRLRAKIGEDTTLIVMSDHGFAPFARKFSLNTWLLENGYLVLKEGKTRELADDDPQRVDVLLNPSKGNVDWSKTRAYGLGFNALYLNLAGRELDDPSTPEDESGIVKRGPEADALLRELESKLEACVDADGTRVIVRCDIAADVYGSARLAEAPDLIVGYNAGYGNSDEASTGRITHAVLADNNRGGTFNGSHLMAPEVVQGMLLSNRPIARKQHGLEDLTVEVLRQYGLAPAPGMQGEPVLEGSSH